MIKNHRARRRLHSLMRLIAPRPDELLSHGSDRASEGQVLVANQLRRRWRAPGDHRPTYRETSSGWRIRRTRSTSDVNFKDAVSHSSSHAFLCAIPVGGLKDLDVAAST